MNLEIGLDPGMILALVKSNTDHFLGLCHKRNLVTKCKRVVLIFLQPIQKAEQSLEVKVGEIDESSINSTSQPSPQYTMKMVKNIFFYLFVDSDLKTVINLCYMIY